MASDLESQMIAVERIESFSAMEQEAQHVIPESDPSPESGWPTKGEIKMSKVAMRYRSVPTPTGFLRSPFLSKDLPLVLDEVTVTIAPKEKVGIVGRTGAGKSSLVTAILRLVELDGGRVFLDGVDVSTIGLRRLRSSVAVIPQVEMISPSPRSLLIRVALGSCPVLRNHPQQLGSLQLVH